MLPTSGGLGYKHVSTVLALPIHTCFSHCRISWHSEPDELGLFPFDLCSGTAPSSDAFKGALARMYNSKRLIPS